MTLDNLRHDGRIRQSLVAIALERLRATRHLFAMGALVFALGADGEAASASEADSKPDSASTTSFPTTSTYPWPNLANDDVVTVRGNGLTVRIFLVRSPGLQSAGGERELPSYVLAYEPVVRLVSAAGSNTEITPKTIVSDDGLEVTIFFRWDESPDTTRAAIYEWWREIGNAGPLPRTMPIHSGKAWFESGRDGKLRSNIFSDQSFSEPGELSAFFRFDSPAEAEAFVRNLDSGRADKPITLAFKYEILGDAEDECWARYTASNITNINRFRELSGVGKIGFVTREQVANVAQNVIRSTHVEARCRDVNAIKRIASAAKVLAGEAKTIAAWKDLEAFTAISKEDFIADVTNAWEKEDTVEDRVQERETTADSDAIEIGGGVGITWGDVVALLTGKFAKASVEAQSSFKDVMSKRGFKGEFQGTKYVPKDLEIYRLEDLHDAWIDGVEVSYVLIQEDQIIHSIYLTKEHFLPDLPVDEEVAFRREIDNFEMDLDGLRTALEGLMESVGGQPTTGKSLAERVGEIEGGIASHYNVNSKGNVSLVADDADFNLHGEDDANVGADDDASFYGRRVSIDGKARVSITGKTVSIKAKEFIVNKEKLPEFRSCTYRLKADKHGGRVQYKILRERDNLAWVGAVSCSDDHPPNVSISRVGREDSRWAIWFDYWRMCRDSVFVQIMFADGLGTERDGTLRSPQTFHSVADIEKFWCSG